MKDVWELAKANEAYIIDRRRYYHAHPEPSMQEVETTKAIAKDLEALGIEMKKHKWDIFAGYRGYQGNNTVSVMYETDDPSGISLLVTLGERLK